MRRKAPRLSSVFDSLSDQDRLSQLFTSMSGGQILDRTNGDDGGWIDLVMGEVRVPLDVIEVHGNCDTVSLIQISQITEEVWIIDNASEVAFEMAVIHSIELDQRYEQAPVGLRACRQATYCRVEMPTATA